MPVRPELLAEIRRTLPAAIVPNLTDRSQGADLYEAYIWSLVVQAAMSEGAVVSFVDVSGRRVTSEFTFRTSPGNIFSTIKPYSHALIQFPNRPDLEAHVGIFVSGKSKVAHECDVAVLRKDEADIARGFSSHPRSSSSKLILAVECKFYVRSSMGIGLARSFLGLLTDIGKDDRFFVGVSEAERIGSLLSSHRKQWENGVSPVDPQERYVRLRKTFEQVFRNFRHKSP